MSNVPVKVNSPKFNHIAMKFSRFDTAEIMLFKLDFK